MVPPMNSPIKIKVKQIQEDLEDQGPKLSAFLEEGLCLSNTFQKQLNDLPQLLQPQRESLKGSRVPESARPLCLPNTYVSLDASSKWLRDIITCSLLHTRD